MNIDDDMKSTKSIDKSKKITEKDLVVLDKLGQGSFAEVYIVKRIDTG
jgi:hypothetical protein